MPHSLTPTQWSELQSAHQHLGEMLKNNHWMVSDTQWSQLGFIHTHIGQIIGVPQNIKPPSISGKPVVGQTLHANSGTWQ